MLRKSYVDSDLPWPLHSKHVFILVTSLPGPLLTILDAHSFPKLSIECSFRKNDAGLHSCLVIPWWLWSLKSFISLPVIDSLITSQNPIKYVLLILGKLWLNKLTMVYFFERMGFLLSHLILPFPYNPLVFSLCLLIWPPINRVFTCDSLEYPEPSNIPVLLLHPTIW